jgi:hypothetical protein
MNMQRNAVLSYILLLCWVAMTSAFHSRVSHSKASQLTRLLDLSHINEATLPVDTSNTRSRIPMETYGWNSSFYASFVKKYWQKRPLLVRGAFIKGFFTDRITVDELLSLAAEEDVESRLISGSRLKYKKDYGPFSLEQIRSLPQANWTILFQEVDRHVASVGSLWDESFSFIPEWRRDDIMISYAAPGGGIGAHVDDYDVFLIQGR